MTPTRLALAELKRQMVAAELLLRDLDQHDPVVIAGYEQWETWNQEYMARVRAGEPDA